jgi:Flp pilus assembly protein TadG
MLGEALFSWIQSMRSALKSFQTRRDGNVAITFAVAVVPLLLMAGASIDYTRASGARTYMQNALDSATLAVARDAGTLSAAQLQTNLKSKFESMLNRPEMTDIHVTAQYASGTLNTSASASLPTSFMALAGQASMDLGVTSGTATATGKLEVVLALDNTGSMAANGKIQALVAASHQFVTALQTADAGTGKIKIAVVPFDTHVNIGTFNDGQPWMDWSLYAPAHTYGSGPDIPDNSIGNGEDYDGVGGGVGHPAWLGCVIDRTQPYDVQNTIPTIDPATWYPAADCTLAPVMPLSNNWLALHAEIDQMHATGNTDLGVGLAWAWNMLTPGAPLSASAPPAPELEKYIVFLTDGVNTQNRWTTVAAQIDARAQAACTNIKASGVKIFTLRVMNGNAALLQNCASDASMYYDITQSNQIASAFEKIVQNFGRLRLSH